ncbi:MAG: TonB-dependent receptor [Chromatiales bacterium]|nr:TonB-dependent receptor [Chromatiales bacterium]
MRTISNYRKKLLAVFLLAPNAYFTAAQAWQGDGAFLEELPVYLSVTRLPQNITEMPAAVTIIDRHMIEASGAVELVDVFRLVPGFQVAYSQGIDGQRAVVMSHGFSDTYARRMQVLIDGVSVYKSSTGGPEWYDLPLIIDDIERIEVIRGPNSATYGANSMIAVINIITRDAASLHGSRLATTLGERRYRRYNLRHGEQFQNLDISLSGEYLTHTGMVNKDDPGRLNDDQLTRRLNLRADYRAGINDYLSANLSGSNGRREVGVDGDLEDPRHQIPIESSMQSASWKHIRDTDTDVTIKISHQRHETNNEIRVDASALIPDTYILNDQSLQTERYSAELTHRFRLSENTRLVWGAERREDIVEGVSYFDLGNRYKMHSNNLSFNLEWRPQSNWIVNLGNMTENNDMFGTYQSPRLAINHLFADGYYLRAAIGRAHRMPALFEEKADYRLYVFNDSGPLMQFGETLFYSAGDISPEKQDSVELALGMERARLGYNLRLFQNRIKNAIYTVRDRVNTDFRREIINDDDVYIRGIEAGLRIKASEQTSWHLSYSHARAEGEMIVRRDPVGTDVKETSLSMADSVPRNTLGLLMDWQVDARQNIGLGFYHVSSLKYLGESDKHTYDDLKTFDMNYRNRYRYKGIDGKWAVLLRDINGRYHTGQNYAWRDTQVFLNLAMEF